ncbi:MAG: ACP S-malonyltransferase, partial [Chitinispirillaceae bacterium]|nr:ACP S-malonyltransferase [Chitinispirillaceae bacterium]
ADIIGKDRFTAMLFECANDLVHEDLGTLCLHGPMRRLLQARLLQPALVAVCLGYWNRLVERGVAPDMVLGHSLGEITSLAAAGIVSAEDCLRIATKRGELMDEVAASCDGGMMAVLFVPMETVEALLEELNAPEQLVLANDNASDQIVLSGDNTLLKNIAATITARKLGKYRKVEVVGPWHSPFMNRAREVFEDWVEPVPFSVPRIPLIFNATAEQEADPATIKRLVTWQLVRPVYWRSSMERLRSMEVDTLFEIGPQRVLSGLARINGFKKSSTIFNINSMAGIERAAFVFIAD